MKKDIVEGDIDFLDLIQIIWSKKIFILKVTGVVVLIGAFIALFSPVMYSTSSILMPEKHSAQVGAGLIEKFGGLVGMSAGSLGSSESGSISPSVYPEIIRGSSFMKEVIHEEIHFQQEELKTSIFDFYQSHYDRSLIESLKSLPLRTYLVMKSVFVSSVEQKKSPDDLYVKLSKEEKEIIEQINGLISINVDDMTGLVSISIKLQDPIAAAELNRLVRDKLIKVLTNYRVKKAKEELNFVVNELAKAEERYMLAQRKLAVYVDRNKMISSESSNIELERLADQKNLTFNLYNTLLQQQEQAKLSLQRETPFFQEIQPITIPIEKSSPRRFLIFFASIFIGGCIGIAVIMVKLLIHQD
jgi:uncharacterized protein involved in exopolysaccharide biosynthesis